MERVGELDSTMAAQVEQARSRGAVLRYAATIEPEQASIAMRELPLSHPLAALRGTDNLFAFTTARYPEQPLVVRGAGAGVEVTAAGVLGDMIATAREI
jgi:homoserine dehydrogenase